LGVAPDVLERDDRQNARGGSAVLAQYARDLGGGQLPTAVGDWYGAVARYSGGTDLASAELFADDVFATVRDGAALITTDGQAIRLAPAADVQPRRTQIGLLHLSDS
jgi:hypothetical protein